MSSHHPRSQPVAWRRRVAIQHFRAPTVCQECQLGCVRGSQATQAVSSVVAPGPSAGALASCQPFPAEQPAALPLEA